MPKYKNSFRSPQYFEETILNENGDVIGTIRIKPSSVLWKPGRSQKYHSVNLEKFVEWITDSNTRAKKTES
jgi:hypothetical protein